MKLLLVLTVLAVVATLQAQWVQQDSGTKVQFRGLAAVSDKICWVAGAEGTFARTIDGTHWTATQIPGLEKLTFRSVVAWDANTATLLAIGAGDLSRIYHTTDGGKSWSLQFKNPDPKAFYDCIQFWDRKHGIALSDPVDGKFRILTTPDGGDHWNVAPNAGMPNALAGEGAFAASGTSLVVRSKNRVWFATGGAAVSRVFRSEDGGSHWSASETPIPAGKSTSGIFGLAFWNAKEGVAVGGDYKDPQSSRNQVAATADGGKSWKLIANAPNALYEGAIIKSFRRLILVGPIGAGYFDYSFLSGIPRPWYHRLDVQGLHCCCGFVGEGGWAAGDDGQIYKWD